MFNMKSLRLFFVFIFCCHNIFTVILGQSTNLDLETNRQQTNSSENWTTVFHEMSICADGDNLSLTYCKCSENVASCDLTSFPGSMSERQELTIFVEQMKHPVKKLCICGSPKHVRVNLTKGNAERINLSSLHRVDIVNFKGPLLLMDAFKSPFAGDIYMTNITFLHSLRSYEFDRGSDLNVQDVQDLECCSKINVPQHYGKPTFYMENAQIGKIHSRGIDSFHLWKTVILKYLTVLHGVEARGISLESTEQVNVNINFCDFRNVESGGIAIRDFQNLVVTKTHFDHASNETALLFTSSVENSSLVLVDNEFNNKMVWNLDAHKIINWFNMYDFWDNWTFAHFPKSFFKDRLLSVEYNTVAHYLIFDESNPVPAPVSSQEEIVFNENIFGICKCSNIFGVHLPSILSNHSNRCDLSQFPENSDSQEVENCFVDFKVSKSECKEENSKLDATKLCKDHGIEKSSFIAPRENLSFKATSIPIISSFVAEMMKDLKFRFHIHHAFKHSESKEEKQYSEELDNETNENNVEQKSSSHFILITFLAILSISVTVGIAYLFIRRRRFRLLTTGDTRYDSTDFLTTAT